MEQKFKLKLESLRLKNFRAFRNAEIKNIPNYCVLVGANGVGKSTVFSVFEFLKDTMESNVNAALGRLGGSLGFREVRSRGSDGPIEIEIKFRIDDKSPLITYFIAINEENGRAIVERESLRYRRGSKGKPWSFLDFSHGKGFAITNELENVSSEQELQREEQTLKASDLLAIKGLAQFEKFPAVMALGELIEKWHVSDFHISKARTTPETGYAEHLSREGENLPLVIQYLHQFHPETFDKILKLLSKRVPGISNVEAKTTEEGRILLKFQDGAFADPFLARYVSDGTIKMLAYLVLLFDPNPHPLLCVEEPENQLYVSLLEELAEDFRQYANRGGQVMVSTHSPDFLNALRPEEVFYIVKKNGYSEIKCAADDEQVVAYVNEGDKLGYLWKQGFLGDVDPQ
jgi:predicted ATPase